MTGSRIGFRWRAPDGREGWACGTRGEAKAQGVRAAQAARGHLAGPGVEQLWRDLAALGWQIVEALPCPA